ncbi:MAG: ImmA/IrrE family metallo-endopeptidase [Myxococcales bacterium]|nr:ImmA/IrrE family metallo-endopeptidase [Myxococcales bacterium]
MISSEQLGDRIAVARKRSKLTQAEIAQRIGASRTTLVAMEKGERRPTSAELVSLARALNVQLHELLRETVSTGHVTPRFRLSRQAPQGFDPSATVAELERLGRRYVELERLNNIARVPAPLEALQTYRVRENERRRAAELRVLGYDAGRSVRNTLGLGDAPALAIEERFEIEAGLRIFHLSLPPVVAAFLAWSDELGACVAINRDHPLERRRWSLIHELGHFLRDREAGDVYLGEAPSTRVEIEEIFPDAFTEEFLLPSAGVTSRFNDRRRANGVAFSIADLLALADLYVVSFEAMTRRLEKLELLPRGTFERLTAHRFRPEKARRELGLTRAHAAPPKFPDRYVTLALLAFETDEFSEGDLADYLDTDRVEARSIHTERRHHRLDGGDYFDADVRTSVLDVS